MFKMMMVESKDLKRLGPAMYFTREPGTKPNNRLVEVKLEDPMFVDARQINMLMHRYSTQDMESAQGRAGAERFRREVLRMGHDGVVAIDWPKKGDVTVASFGPKTGERGIKEVIMKDLRKYLVEAQKLDEARKRVEVMSDSEKSKRALYDLKKQLDAIDGLKSFKYVGKSKDNRARAQFEVSDRDQFDILIESVSKKHRVDLKPC